MEAPMAALETRARFVLRHRPPSWLIAAVQVLWVVPAAAQAIDTTLSVTNGPVSTVVRDANTIYIGGDFTLVGPSTDGAPLSTASGSLIEPFPRVEGDVWAVVSDGAGGWYIGGNFSAVGGVPRSKLAHILADGSVASWDPNPDGPVYALSASVSTVYAGGFFTNIGGQARNYIAALDAATGTATAWDPNPDYVPLTLVV